MCKIRHSLHGMKECLMGSHVCPCFWEIIYASKIVVQISLQIWHSGVSIDCPLATDFQPHWPLKVHWEIVSYKDYSMDLILKTLGQHPLIRFFRVKFTFTQCSVMKSVLLCHVSTIYYSSLHIATFFSVSPIPSSTFPIQCQISVRQKS